MVAVTRKEWKNINRLFDNQVVPSLMGLVERCAQPIGIV